MRATLYTEGMAVDLTHLTWNEAEQALADCKVVILPIGAALKEHGPHLPLSNDFITAEYLRRRLMRIEKCVFAATLNYGYYPAFLEYPGSTSLNRETMMRVVVEIFRSFVPFGPRKFYALNTGISTLWSLEPARQELSARGLEMEYTRLNEIATDLTKSIEEQKRGSHADEIETSTMLYIASEVVRCERAANDSGSDNPGPLTRQKDNRNGCYSPSGIFGDSTLASLRKGEIYVEALVEGIRKDIEDFRDSAQAHPKIRRQYL